MSMTRITTPNRSTTPDFRKDTYAMHWIDLRLAEAQERQSLLRSHRAADRAAGMTPRSFRLRLGASLIAIGRRLGGDAVTTPAWQG